MSKVPDNPVVQGLVEKVINKLVRIVTIDGREYLANLNCVDKTGALFVVDALEIVNKDFDKPGCQDLFHELYTPYMLNMGSPSDKAYKYMGNIVIKREHVVKIYLDTKSNAVFEELKKLVRERSFTNFQSAA